jgi:hypothetical protein
MPVRGCAVSGRGTLCEPGWLSRYHPGGGHRSAGQRHTSAWKGRSSRRRFTERSQDCVVHRRQLYRARTPPLLAKTRPTAMRSSLRHSGQRRQGGSLGDGSGSDGVGAVTMLHPRLVRARPREGPWSIPPVPLRHHHHLGLMPAPFHPRRHVPGVPSMRSGGRRMLALDRGSRPRTLDTASSGKPGRARRSSGAGSCVPEHPGSLPQAGFRGVKLLAPRGSRLR